MPPESKNLSWNKTQESNVIDEHLKFAKSLLETYKFEDANRIKLEEALKEISDKQKDYKLNLSVIGEFSTGKSTFINALLRKDLMASQYLQGTTVTATAIEYSENYTVTLKFNDGYEKKYNFDDFEALKSMLYQINENSEEAKALHSVCVGLPSKGFLENIRVIDTPGTNVEHLWHEDVTVRALEEMSDVSVVLIDATQVLPESLIRFVRNNLEPVLSQCVFVVTKIDCVRKAERKGILKFVEIKLQQEFEIEEPVVIPYDSLDILLKHGFRDVDKPDLEADCELVEMSYASEKIMFDRMTEQRSISMQKKIHSLISGMYESISENMRKISSDYEQELEILKRTQNADLEAFLIEQKNKRKQAYNEKVMQIRCDIFERIYNRIIELKNIINSFIYKQNDVLGINTYLNNTLKQTCFNNSQMLFNMAGQAKIRIDEIYKNEMCEFEQNFTMLFEDLSILPLDLTRVNTTYNFNSGYNFVPGFENISRNINEELAKKQNRPNMYGFMGAVMDGVMSTFAKRKTDPEINYIKQSVVEQLDEPLSEYFGEVLHQAIYNIDNTILEFRELISLELVKYLNTYNSYVDEKVRQTNEKKDFVEKQIEKIKIDLNAINERRESINQVVVNDNEGVNSQNE